MSEKKICPVCSEPIIGRMDKKFCSDQCRNSYNNQKNIQSSPVIRNINKILANNHRILLKLNPEGKTKVSKKRLVSGGFNFDYFTSIYNTQKGTTYYFCYEQGYLPLEGEFYALVERKFKV
jgi:predicted nucleic acid-binding Zn ribbon protein